MSARRGSLCIYATLPRWGMKSLFSRQKQRGVASLEACHAATLVAEVERGKRGVCGERGERGERGNTCARAVALLSRRFV